MATMTAPLKETTRTPGGALLLADATLLREMPRRKAKYGIVTMCVGGGMGAAGSFEAIS